MKSWSYLLIGTLIGGSARYVIAKAIYDRWGTGFPYGTLVVNLTGCLLIGFFYSLAHDKLVLDHNQRLLLMTGFCGAYTTFSAFVLESSFLLEGGKAGPALLYILISVTAGMGLFQVGAWMGRLL